MSDLDTTLGDPDAVFVDHVESRGDRALSTLVAANAGRTMALKVSMDIWNPTAHHGHGAYARWRGQSWHLRAGSADEAHVIAKSLCAFFDAAGRHGWQAVTHALTTPDAP